MPKQIMAEPLPGKPPCKVRRLTGWMGAVFSAPGKMIVPYSGEDGHLYVRYGQSQWARVVTDPPPKPKKRKPASRRGG